MFYLVWTAASHVGTVSCRAAADWWWKHSTSSLDENTSIWICTVNSRVTTVPHDIFTERKKRLLLVVAEHLEHDGLSLDVVHEGFSNFNGDL